MVSATCCMSQKLKVVKSVNSEGEKEIYYVLKSNRTIRHGMYLKIGRNRQLLEQGSYENNIKNNIWTKYVDYNKFDLNGYYEKKVRKKSFYKNGYVDSVWIYNTFNDQIAKKVYYFNNETDSTWVCFDDNERKEYIFDFRKNDVVEYNWNNKSREYYVYREEIWVEEQIDSPPIILNPFVVAQEIVYPPEALRKGIKGQVLVSVTIDETGEMGDIKIEKAIHELLDKEALRVIKKCNLNWFPAKRNGQKVTVKEIVPINFFLGT